MQDNGMKEGREKLFRHLNELGIEAPTVPYPSHRSVKEGKALRGDMCGMFTKNLLLKDKKGWLFLVVAQTIKRWTSELSTPVSAPRVASDLPPPPKCATY